MHQDDIAAHAARFEVLLDAGLRGFGVAEGLSGALRAAVAATPRHRFVHRFRVGDGALQDLDATPSALLPIVYSDTVLRHVDAAGEALASSNSQPSYIVFLLHLLDLRPGQRVLEIGSGSGWLAALMARLVGEAGSVTGIEILPDLARQSRADLDAMGLDRVSVLARDGTHGHQEGAPFDRVMITAGTWDLPGALFDQVAEGGCVLAPIEERGGTGCQVTVLRRVGTRFVAERGVAGWFVPLTGATQRRGAARQALSDLGFWPAIEATQRRFAWPLGLLPGGAASPLVLAFRLFLGRTEPGFRIFGAPEVRAIGSWASAQPFGIVDAATRSVAMWRAGELIAHGDGAAAGQLVRAYLRWTGLGLPGMGAFDLTVARGDAAPPATDATWIDQRGDSALIWRLKPGLAAWRGLVAAGDTDIAQSLEA